MRKVAQIPTPNRKPPAPKSQLPTPLAAFRTLWTALVGLYEETLVLVAGNLAALALNVPFGLLLFLLGLLVPAIADVLGTSFWLVVVGCLVLFLPTPGNVALAGLTRVAAGPDVPRLGAFREALGAHWRLALRCSALSVVVTVALAWNVAFYFSIDWLRIVTILWLYALLFWLALHIYLVPLLVHVSEPRLFDLYRRAAFVSLGHLGYTLLLLLPLLVLAFASAVLLIPYLLVAGAFISLVQAHALREIRRRHGDLVVEQEEEVSRL